MTGTLEPNQKSTKKLKLLIEDNYKEQLQSLKKAFKVSSMNLAIERLIDLYGERAERDQRAFEEAIRSGRTVLTAPGPGSGSTVQTVQPAALQPVALQPIAEPPPPVEEAPVRRLSKFSRGLDALR
ncbi:hypothetical protein [Leptolyngbya sp. FACHB-261]|uniref:hypothetical protein n=1 Tax=Leptolyngbya sp. FACHB-261 TaxID=2692806 RepID=UPI0016856FFA|nr:hypothetical protein [Leptolyngbya sp. FACHB-261]MBD2100325.1 hypothetical protein [Leptolyngbya sp. FACHB-261]